MSAGESASTVGPQEAVEKRTIGVWTEQPGMMIDVIEENHRVHICAIDKDQGADAGGREVLRLTLALDGRRAIVGAAILSPADQHALKVGRLLVEAARQMWPAK